MKTTLAVLAVSALAVAPLQAQTVMKGDFILQHQIANVLLEFTKLAKAGKPDEAAKLQSARAAKRRADRAADDRKESDAFVKDFLPAPAALEESIKKNGSLTVEGDKATLQISVSTSTKNPDGSVTASAEAMAFAFVFENDNWRLDQ
jgi:Tfp pilus assembly protein PilV